MNLLVEATGGDGGGGASAAGGAASGAISDMQVSLGESYDLLSAIVEVDGGTGSGSGANGAESIEFERNTFDLGAGDDQLTIRLAKAGGGRTTLAGNTFSGGEGDGDLLSFDTSGAIELDYAINRVNGFESIVGSNLGDRFAGKGEDDRFEGGLGDDLLDGRTGDDALIGGGDGDTLAGRAGDDVLTGGAGDDLADGGKGVDTAVFGGAAGITADLELGTASGEGADQLRRVENLIGTVQGDDFTGSRYANVLFGGDGDDSLDGGGGKDTLIGGQSQDELDGGDGGDTYVFQSFTDSTEATPDTVTGWGPHDIIDLAGVDADRTLFGDQAFTVAAGAPPGTPALGVLYVIDTGSVVELHADTDDDGVYDFAVLVETERTITASDFIL